MLNILDCTPIAQFAIGLDHKITFWNRACELLTGYTAGEMVGTDHQWIPFYPDKRPVLADLIVADDFRKLEALYDKKRASKSDIIPFAWQATDYFKNLGGKSRHIFFVAAAVVDGDGRIMGAVETLQDITKRVEAQEDLLASEKRYRMLTEKVADGIILFQEGRLLFANEVSAEMLGCNCAKDLIGRKAEDFIAEDFRETFKMMRRDFEKSEFREKIVKMKCIKDNGQEIWLETHNEFVQWKGKPAVLATVQDITESRIREMAIRTETIRLRKENKRLRNAAGDRYRFGRIIGKSHVMQKVYDVILKAAAADENVIVLGESGTGKELVARAIHEMSDRKENEFVPVNCGAIPEALMESEFFGHKRGAFTNAFAETHGYLALAHGGVLFLDEVGDLPLNMQVKLLRAIEGGGYTPVGGNRLQMSDCRIIAATNRDMKRLVQEGLMREDFFYRMHVIPVQVPPLRDRKEDIPLLVEHFLKTYEKDLRRPTLSGKLMEAIHNYHWPGNVRELQNMVRRYLAVGHVDFLEMGFDHPDKAENPPLNSGECKGKNLAAAIEHFERDLVISALTRNQWHKARAAAHLGISRRTLFRKIKNLELT